MILFCKYFIQNGTIQGSPLNIRIDDGDDKFMTCFCGKGDRRKALSLISCRDHCQRFSPSKISDTPAPSLRVWALLNEIFH